MKKVLAIIIYLTASLSFVHSEILDKTNDDAFIYDYSQVCADTKNCTFPATFDALYTKTYSFFDIYDFTECTNSEFITDVHGIPPCPIQCKDLSIKKYGFSSKADANAFFNIHILNNIPNNQLGYLRWITYKVGNAIKSYIINFGATITEHLAPPLFPLYKTFNDTTDNTFSYKYLWLCNDAMNCQFIKRTDICDTSSHVFSSYDSHTAFSDKCNPYMSYRYIPLELPGFSSETDAKINIQIFDSPVFLENEQNRPTKIQHDF